MMRETAVQIGYSRMRKINDPARDAYSESGPIKPIDHFGIAVEDFSQDSALAAIERVVPGTKIEKNGTASIFVTGPDGVRVQIMAAAKK